MWPRLEVTSAAAPDQTPSSSVVEPAGRRWVACALQMRKSSVHRSTLANA